MIYLIGQLSACLFVAGFIGLSIGWILSKLKTEAQLNFIIDGLKSQINKSDAALASINEKVTFDEKLIESLNIEVREKELQNIQLSKEIINSNNTIRELDNNIEPLKLMLSDARHQLIVKTEMNHKLAEKNKILIVNFQEKTGEISNLKSKLSFLNKNENKSHLAEKRAKNIEGPFFLDKSRSRDDLKRIYGISSLQENMLNDLGIMTFNEISKWTEKDIEPVAEKIGTPAEQIKKDNWISQAKELASAEINDSLSHKDNL